jgi:nitrite reductase/ring-hydroxylating ferredoxin subunit
LFEIDGGRCIGGPCLGSRLKPWPVTVVEEIIVTAAVSD